MTNPSLSSALGARLYVAAIRKMGVEMAGHDDYGKLVLREATKGIGVHYGASVEIDYGAGQPARIDATVGDIAIEVESRVSKQVRGAVLDLICHAYPKKLLVLLPVHMSDAAVTAVQSRNIMKRFCSEGSFRVVVLKGSGDNYQLAEDSAILAAALADLGGVRPPLASATVSVSTAPPTGQGDGRIEPPTLSGIGLSASPPSSGRRGSKYDPLRDYLLQQHLREIELTFGEIESILGSPLPPVSERPQWWANQVAPGRPQREAWRAAGYDAFLVASSRKVRFRKVP